MSGYSRLYCIGDVGGFMGQDGINPIWCQIWVGDADRQWWTVHYVQPDLGPLGGIKVVVPEGPDHPNALIDCCLAFLPHVFDGCPSMGAVRTQSEGLTRLDFDAQRDKVPAAWAHLRDEAREQFQGLQVFEAILRKVDLRPR